MTHETAENILVGHFEPEGHRHSWLVAAGSNPAYEQFALQCPGVTPFPNSNSQLSGTSSGTKDLEGTPFGP